MFRPLVVVAPLLGLAAVGAAFSQESSGESAPPPASHAFRSIAQYQIPDVRLVRDDGKAVSLPEEMNDGRPVVLNFIFTTCSTICPLMSQTLAHAAPGTPWLRIEGFVTPGELLQQYHHLLEQSGLTVATR